MPIKDGQKRVEAGQDVKIDLLIGAELIEATVPNATGPDVDRHTAYAAGLRPGGGEAISQALSPELAELMYRHHDRRFDHTYPRELVVGVDPQCAHFSAWYEFFPRSFGPKPGQHGTFKDAEAMLPYVASMGFDVLYLPPIHPIGLAHRKETNNAPDPHHRQSGYVDLPLDAFELDFQRPYQVPELITDVRYLWNGSRDYVELNRHVTPFHIFRLRRYIRTERDFNYFL